MLGNFGGFTTISLMMIPFAVISLLVVGVFAFVFVRILRQTRKDDRSPRLTVDAVVVAKRTHISGSAAHNSYAMSGHTTYYATFQVQSGDRMELNVPAGDYGYLIEGDRGQLSFQGARFLSFRRGSAASEL